MSPSSRLILVDPEDRVLGHTDRDTAHRGDGLLHRAFSIFLFAPDGRVLLQKRSHEKPLWPDHWANTCCSHPREGERLEDAAPRRLVEELGVSTPLAWLYRFRYQARFEDRGSENELCSVFTGELATDAELRPDPAEVAELRWLAPDELTRELAENPRAYTPWLHLEWPRVRER